MQLQFLKKVDMFVISPLYYEHFKMREIHMWPISTFITRRQALYPRQGQFSRELVTVQYIKDYRVVLDTCRPYMSSLYIPVPNQIR